MYSEAIAWRGTSRLNFSVSKREGKWDEAGRGNMFSRRSGISYSPSKSNLLQQYRNGSADEEDAIQVTSLKSAVLKVPQH